MDNVIDLGAWFLFLSLLWVTTGAAAWLILRQVKFGQPFIDCIKGGLFLLIEVMVSLPLLSGRLQSEQTGMNDLMEHQTMMTSTRTGMSRGLNFLATIEGGIGPNVWDKEVEVTAPSLREARALIEQQIEDGTVTSIEQVD
ncbi:hypothetical protein [Marinobacterium sp. BA1]|uniref:hypothetical protein n=1 Tax=Marinobacterium sp. BA1 TaxID=3138931 RepID=UPI0032E5C705